MESQIMFRFFGASKSKVFWITLIVVAEKVELEIAIYEVVVVNKLLF
jgi:hypothetical protein